MRGISDHPRAVQLRNFVAGRPVCFQCPGPSVVELVDNLHKIPEDAVWMAHNSHLSTEPIIEDGIGRRLDIVYASSSQSIESYGHHYVDFVCRPDDNLFLTTTGAIQAWGLHQDGFLAEFIDKIIIGRCEMGSAPMENAYEVLQMGGMFFSVVFATLMLMKAGVHKIVFFGLDGGIPNKYEGCSWYYGDSMEYPGQSVSQYNAETGFINGNWEAAVEAAELDLDDFSIVNCSVDSAIRCFERMDYEDLGLLFGCWSRKENK